MKTKNFFLTAALVVATALTGAMMTSCSKIDIPVADNDGYPPLPKGKIVNLSEKWTDYVAVDGDTLTGLLNASCKLSIADGATVTLSRVSILDGNDYPWAGITCLGDATIVLADNTNNEINGQDKHQPGIQAGGKGTTLTIRGGEDGTGILFATGGNGAAGIGCGYEGKCGNIKIEGGSIMALGGEGAAGIGSGFNGSCGDIIISMPAKGTAKGGKGSPFDIGAGKDGTCGIIFVEDDTIEGSWDGSPIVAPNGGGGGGDSPISDPNGSIGGNGIIIVSAKSSF